MAPAFLQGTLSPGLRRPVLLQVTRVEDGRTFTVEGNLRQYKGTGSESSYGDTARIFPVSLLAGYTYEITIVPGTIDPDFVPDIVGIEYKDGPGCGQGLTLRIRGSITGKPSVHLQGTGYTMTLCQCKGRPHYRQGFALWPGGTSAGNPTVYRQALGGPGGTPWGSQAICRPRMMGHGTVGSSTVVCSTVMWYCEYVQKQC